MCYSVYESWASWAAQTTTALISAVLLVKHYGCLVKASKNCWEWHHCDLPIFVHIAHTGTDVSWQHYMLSIKTKRTRNQHYVGFPIMVEKLKAVALAWLAGVIGWTAYQPMAGITSVSQTGLRLKKIRHHTVYMYVHFISYTHHTVAYCLQKNKFKFACHSATIGSNNCLVVWTNVQAFRLCVVAVCRLEGVGAGAQPLAHHVVVGDGHRVDVYRVYQLTAVVTRHTCASWVHNDTVTIWWAIIYNLQCLYILCQLSSYLII